MKFDELDIQNETLEALRNGSTPEVTDLQKRIISVIGDEHNLIIKVENEEEKAEAIAVVILETLHATENNENTGTLAVVSSSDEVNALCKQLKQVGISEDTYCCIDEEGDTGQQAKLLTANPPVIVATPGRLKKLLYQEHHVLRHVGLVVLDGLDEMLADGHSHALNRIKLRVLSNFNTLVCTSDFNEEIEKVSTSFGESPVIAGFEQVGNPSIKTPPSIADTYQQSYINVPPRKKISTLTAHLYRSSPNRCIIFTASKRGTDRLYQALKKQNMRATSLHGKLSDQKRKQRFENFTNGDASYLLVADISAAELGLHDIDEIINYDVPNSADEYRFRTALLKSSSSSRILSLVSKQDRDDINELQKELEISPEEQPLPKKVQQKLNQKHKQKSKKGNNGQKKKTKQKGDSMELPKPSYDKLSGGRKGNHDEKKSGIVKFFKKLFNA